MTRSLQSRVLALAGIGVFAASTALTLLSRQSLLTIEAAAERTATRTTPFGARGVGRDTLTDREAFESLAGTVATETAAFRSRSLWLAPGLTAVALLLAWGVVTSVRRPVGALTDAAERIAAGDLSHHIPSDIDEIGRLGAALEHMRVQLRDSIASVESANAVLEDRVRARTAQLSRVLRRVISAQEDERRRVARELHDETSQLVAAMAMTLATAGDMPTARALSDLRRLVDRMHDSLHRIIANLRPAVLDDLGLAAAIEWLAEHQLRRAGISARCELSELQDCRADSAVEITLFRVVQESITNIVRHASASAVLIQAGIGPEHLGDPAAHLWIEIEDDGNGFDPSAVREEADTLRGVGLMGMRERMELIGGSIVIDSAPDEGTRIRIDAPLRVGEEVLS